MTMSDYGPLPMAQFKERSSEMFAALDAGRRVLLSRHGRVVAAIDPASVATHAPLLASYALHDSSVTELSPKTIGQGSPAGVIRLVEAGSPAVVTRDSKVYGVMSAVPIVPMTAADASSEEERLAAFELEHPDATPEEYAEFSELLTAEHLATVAESSTTSAEVVELTDGISITVPTLSSLLADAMHVKGVALVQSRDYSAAEEALQGAIEVLDRSPDRGSQAKSAELLVEIGKLYVAEGRPADAANVADEAVRRIHRLGA